MKIRPYLVIYDDTKILGPVTSAEFGRRNIGLGFLFLEVGLKFTWGPVYGPLPSREGILVKGLADIVNNFGRGSFSGSPVFKEFRGAAAETLKKAGYVYREGFGDGEGGAGWIGWYLHKEVKGETDR